MQTSRKLRPAERGVIAALAPGFGERRLDDAQIIQMQDGGMGSIRFVGEENRHRAGPIAEATYLDDDGVPVSVELNVDEAGRLFELDLWKVDFSPLRRFPSPEDLRPMKPAPLSLFVGGGTRAEALRQMSPHLVADVYLYPTTEGGKTLSAHRGWGCPCSCSKSADTVFYDGWPLLDAPFAPGECRRLGFVFLHGKYIVVRILRLFCTGQVLFISGKDASLALENESAAPPPSSLTTKHFLSILRWVVLRLPAR